MILIEFLVTFFLMLIIGSVIIIGWYAISRGRIETGEDNIAFRTGKLFKAWHFFFAQKISTQVYLKEPDKKFEDYSGVKFCKDEVGCYLENTPSAIFNLAPPMDYPYLEIVGAKIYFYKCVTKYKFPEWVRDPLSECPTCMASVYGSVIYWSIILFSNISIFSWSNSPELSALMFWIFYCVGCAFLNTVFAKKL